MLISLHCEVACNSTTSTCRRERNHPRPHRCPPGRHAGVSLVRCASNPVCIPRTSGWPAVSRVAYFQTKMPSRLPETNVAMAKQATRHPRDGIDRCLIVSMYVRRAVLKAEDVLLRATKVE